MHIFVKYRLLYMSFKWRHVYKVLNIIKAWEIWIGSIPTKKRKLNGFLIHLFMHNSCQLTGVSSFSYCEDLLKFNSFGPLRSNEALRKPHIPEIISNIILWNQQRCVENWRVSCQIISELWTMHKVYLGPQLVTTIGAIAKQESC